MILDVDDDGSAGSHPGWQRRTFRTFAGAFDCGLSLHPYRCFFDSKNF
jgi:hypothetical protein